MNRPMWLDRLVSSDPALTRLLSATSTIVSMGLIFLAEWAVVDTTGALGSSVRVLAKNSPDAISLIARHHEVTIIAMLIGGLLALIVGLSIDEVDNRGTAIGTLLPAVPLILALLITLVLGSHTWLVLLLTPLLLGIGTLFRRYGPRGYSAGIMLYVGGFFGFFLYPQFGFRAFGWLILEIAVAEVVLLLVRLTIFRPRPDLARKRTINSYASKTRIVTQLAITVLTSKDEKASKRLSRELVRLNELALIIEAYLPKSKTKHSPAYIRQLLFDLELSLSNLARFSDSLSRLNLDPSITSELVHYLRAIPGSDASQISERLRKSLVRWRNLCAPQDNLTPILLGRLTEAMLNLNLAALRWKTLDSHEPKESDLSFEHIAQVRGGSLPGSAIVSAAASTAPWSNSYSSVGLPPEVRTAIQIAIATALATGLGYVIDPQRFYWASLSALICFMGTNNAGEQVRKGVYRFLGTVIGIALGSVLAKLIGPNSLLSVLTILSSLFLGVYLFKVNYTFLAIGVTVAISMVYLQLSEFSNALLIERLVETAAGALVASITALFILPLSPRRVIATARGNFLTDLEKLIEASFDYLGNPELENKLVGWVREVDSDYQALIASATPLQWSMLGELNNEVTQLITRATATRNYSRSLVTDVRSNEKIPANFVVALKPIIQALGDSIRRLTSTSPGTTGKPYLRISSTLESLKTQLGLEPRPDPMSKVDLIIRDLALIDGSLAALAKTLGVQIENLDTSKIEGSLFT